MSQSLSRWQAVVLGLVVIAAIGAGGYGISRIAERQGLFADSFEVTAGFPDAHDVSPGTVVRIRGVDAGQVVAVEYPDHDGPGAEVTVRMKLSGKFADRVFADATAQIQGPLLGAKIVSVQPGTPQRGVLADGRLKGLKSFGTDDAMAEVRDLAAEAKGLISVVRESNGTVMQLIKDDSLHKDVKALVAKADKAVSGLDAQVNGMGTFISEGRETLRSVKQGSDAMSRLPIVRSYVEDAAAILVKPNFSREVWTYTTEDLFQPGGTAILHTEGATHLGAIVAAIRANTNKNSEIVVAAFCDPADKSLTAAAAHELSKKQAERVVEQLRYHEVHKLGTFSRRKVTPIGMGMDPSPVVEKPSKDPLPATRVQVILFTPL